MLTLTLRDLCRHRHFPFHIEYSVFSEHTCQLHQHEFAELVIVRHGHGSHVINGETYGLEFGDVFVILPGDTHGYEEMVGIDLVNIIFDPERFLPISGSLTSLPGYQALFHLEPLYRKTHQSMSRLRLNKAAMRWAYDILEEIDEEYVGGKPGFESAIANHFGLLALFLARQYGEQPSSASEELLRLASVHTFLDIHYAESIRLADLATMAHMSENAFLRAFQRCYQCSPIQRLLQIRLNRARDLLTQTQLTICAIARQTGFDHPSHFARAFKQAHGRSPREYRSTNAAPEETSITRRGARQIVSR